MTTANETQVGGAHYRLPIQPWDYILANGLGFLEGNAIKYLTRWRQKGGVEDLRKARHYLDKLIEVAEQEVAPRALGQGVVDAEVRRSAERARRFRGETQ